MKLSEKIALILNEGAHDVMGFSSFGAEEKEVETQETVEELVEDVKLSGEAIKTLSLMAIAERLINESVDDANEELTELGFITEGKMTPKAKEWYTKYFSTLFAS